MPLSYAFILAFLFVVFFVLEFMLPSGGLLGVCAAISLFSAIAIAFTHSLSMGIGFVIVAITLTPLMFFLLVRLWPKTFLGRRILNDPSLFRSQNEATDRASHSYADLVGRTGIAVTDMLPSGLIKIEGKRYDAVSTGVAIDRQSAVEVVQVIGRIIHVRPTEKIVENSSQKTGEPETPSLETPVESLGIEDLSDPLG